MRSLPQCPTDNRGVTEGTLAQTLAASAAAPGLTLELECACGMLKKTKTAIICCQSDVDAGDAKTAWVHVQVVLTAAPMS